MCRKVRLCFGDMECIEMETIDRRRLRCTMSWFLGNSGQNGAAELSPINHVKHFPVSLLIKQTCMCEPKKPLCIQCESEQICADTSNFLNVTCSIRWKITNRAQSYILPHLTVSVPQFPCRKRKSRSLACVGCTGELRNGLV